MRILLEWLDVYGIGTEILLRRKWQLVSVVLPLVVFFSAYTFYQTTSLLSAIDSVYNIRAHKAGSVSDVAFFQMPQLRGAPLYKLSNRAGEQSLGFVMTTNAKVTTPESFQKARHCLAQAMYFEARSEPKAGWQAVGDVVINRVRDRRYPDSICEVVFQGEFRRHRCQFSFACDGRSDLAYNEKFWNASYDLAGELLIKGSNSEIAGLATHYHADYVAPKWAAQMQALTKIGRHIFYIETPQRRKPQPLERPENNL